MHILDTWRMVCSTPAGDRLQTHVLTVITHEEVLIPRQWVKKRISVLIHVQSAGNSWASRSQVERGRLVKTKHLTLRDLVPWLFEYDKFF